MIVAIASRKKTAVRAGVMAMLAVMYASLSYFFGEITKLHEILFFVMALDYVTGIFVAIAQKKLHSLRAFVGVTKKVAILALVALSYQLDQLFGGDSMICGIVIGFFIANEFISVAENYKILGLPMPSAISNALSVIGKKSDIQRDEQSHG